MLIPNGTKVYIKNGWLAGEWGIVKRFDGNYYHVAIANDSKNSMIYSRVDLRVPRKKV